VERELEQEAAALEAKAKAAASKAKAKAKSSGKKLHDNADNPVFIGNAVLGVALVGGLGYFGYVKHRAGELDWGVVGIGAAVIGVVGVADYYTSQ
jgi:hypothetical protein